MLGVLALLLGLVMPASGQGQPALFEGAGGAEQEPDASPPERRASAPEGKAPMARPIRCQTPANPRKLYFECVGKEFDVIEETLTKDWGGVRTELIRLGITPTASYTTQLMGNPRGGQAQGFTYAGTLQAAITWDLHKLLSIPGLSFNVGASWSSGESLTGKYIDNDFTVQSAFTGSGTVNLEQMYVQQQLLDGTLALAAGRLAPGNTFATLPVFSNYLNAGINAVPGSISINDPTFASSPPGVEWGAQTMYNVTPAVQVAVGVFNTNPVAAAGGEHGVNFALQQGNTGVLAVGQINYLVNHAPGDAGLPGQYTIGGYYDSNTFSSLSAPDTTVSGSYGAYAMFQQMVHRDGGPDSRQGLTVWGAVALSPRPSVSSMPYFLGGGLSYQGLVRRRTQDVLSAGVICGTFSRYVARASPETVIEASYQIALTPWLSITPDLQYVIRPGGRGDIPGALVLGVQLAATF